MPIYCRIMEDLLKYRGVYVTHFLFSPSKTSDCPTFGYIAFYHELPVKAEPLGLSCYLLLSKSLHLVPSAPSKPTFTKQKRKMKILLKFSGGGRGKGNPRHTAKLSKMRSLDIRVHGHASNSSNCQLLRVLVCSCHWS